MRKTLIAGNWKMHTTIAEARQLAGDITQLTDDYTDREVLLAPPFTVLAEVARVVSDSSIIIGGQNVCWAESGAFTGEISPAMLKDCGATAAIIGHSERRQLFKENNSLINKRVKGALNFDLTTILCIGETLEERQSHRTFALLESQIREGLFEVTAAEMAKIVIAYEPVWAIGTGQTASKEQVQETHFFIRQLIGRMFEKKIAAHLRILYGGSVKPANVDGLMQQPDVDGALVGGAALDAESFGRIINYAR